MKLVGYSKLKDKEGKILYLLQEASGNNAVGLEPVTEFVFDELSRKITADSVGKDVLISYGKRYDGKAFVTNLTIE